MRDGRDLAGLVVPAAGELIATGDRYEPYRLAGPDGAAVEPVTEFFRDVLAAGRPEATVRSYGMDLLRWFRFIWAAGIAWDRADQQVARDFSRWLQVSARGGRGYAAAVRAHSETVLRGFYAYHLEAGTGPVLNPFPLDRSRRRGRPGAHHNPMDPHQNQRGGRYRPKLVSRVPRAVSDEEALLSPAPCQLPWPPGQASTCRAADICLPATARPTRADQSIRRTEAAN